MSLRAQDVPQSINLIAINPGVRSGRPYIVGTTITVLDIAIAQNYHQRDAAGIAEWYGLSLSQVHAALAYYYEHQGKIDDLIAAQIRHAEELQEHRVGNAGSLLP
ncbi:MAG: DUF433 domain-containing protein [Anaerolineae bacterium]|nr:DUF433 domain-containing protein [Anaerolineae bacterium]